MPLILNQPSRPAGPPSRLTPGPNAAAAAAGLRRAERRAKSARVKSVTLTLFTQQLAAMLEAGLPLVTCLEALMEQTEDPVFRVIIREVRNDIASGTPFSEAARKWPNVFPNIFSSLAEAGEASGTLPEMLEKVAGYFEASLKLQKKVKSAMTYPIVVISLAAILVNVLLIFVVPQFTAMFESFGKELPGPTQALVDVTNFLKGNILGFTQTAAEYTASELAKGVQKAKIVINPDSISDLALIPWNTIYLGCGGYGLFLFLRRFVTTQRGKTMRDRLVRRMPIVGELSRKIAVSRFCRTFSILLRGGVPILKVIDICSRASDNVFIEEACADIGKHLNHGGQLSEIVAMKPYFHTMVRHMIRAGEQTGGIDAMLVKVADFFDQEIDNAVSSLTSLMEPLLITGLGLIVGTIVLCMFLPIFQLSTVAG